MTGARILPAPGKPDLLLAKLAGARTKGWYAVALRRDSAGRDSRRLLLHALGPAHHLGELLAGVALLCAVLVGLAVLSASRSDANTVQDIGWIFACMLMSIPIASTLRLERAMDAYPGEQALLRLAPAMPGAAAPFNRHLGHTLLRTGLTGWTLSTGAALLLTALSGASIGSLLLLASICCLVLPLLAAPLRNHAGRARRHGLVPVLLMAAAAGASIGVGVAVHGMSGLPAMPVAAMASIAIAAWSITRGLRVMDSAPFAFPAGRMD